MWVVTGVPGYGELAGDLLCQVSWSACQAGCEVSMSAMGLEGSVCLPVLLLRTG